MSRVITVWVILRENHNWPGNSQGAVLGAYSTLESIRIPKPTA
jgi:hypothetical protein